MRQGDVLVFVEVRYRYSAAFVAPEATVDERKQRKLLYCARHYLQRHATAARRNCRFDVLGITGPVNGNLHYHWVIDAFRA